MYKDLTDQDYKEMLSLPPDYKVAGFLSYGHWNLSRKAENMKKALSKLDGDFQIKQLSEFLGRVYEIKTSKCTYWFTVVYGGVRLCEYLHFACLFGSKKNIHIGSCGGLCPQMESLDYIIPEWSFGNESTTRSYDRDNQENIHYPDQELSNEIKRELGNQNYWKGPIMTCEAMVAETKEDIDRWTQEGYYGVEMETSTIFAISNHFEVPSASLLYVSDNLVKGQVVGDEEHKKQKKDRWAKSQEMIDIGIRVLFS
ncbi:MAG: Purine or other phosphorylase family 1 [Microgenomates bacterium 39_6]|nr:MAG: Purine or other phosphorylase family 1 [Microgenomates bacterium 39_6]